MAGGRCGESVWQNGLRCGAANPFGKNGLRCGAADPFGKNGLLCGAAKSQTKAASPRAIAAVTQCRNADRRTGRLLALQQSAAAHGLSRARAPLLLAFRWVPASDAAVCTYHPRCGSAASCTSAGSAVQPHPRDCLEGAAAAVRGIARSPAAASQQILTNAIPRIVCRAATTGANVQSGASLRSML